MDGKVADKQNNHINVGVGVLLFNQDGQILLGQRLGSHGNHEYAGPGGHLEPLESITECARREVREETGLEITNVQCLRIMNLLDYAPKHYLDIGLSAELAVSYDPQMPQLLEPDKCGGWNWYSLDQLPENLFATVPSMIQAHQSGKTFFDRKNDISATDQLIKVFGNATYLTHFTPQQIEKLCQLHPIWADQQSDELWISLFKEYWKVDMPTFYRKNPRKSFLNNIPPPRNSSTIAAGRYNSLGILEDGTAIGWGGSNDYGQTDVPDTNGKKFVAIAAGAWHSLAILDDGTVKAWGENDYGETDVPDTNGKKIVAIAAGFRHSFGILDDGTVKAWGWNKFGQTDIPDTNGKKFVAIAAGAWQSLGILEDGTVLAWGENDYGQTNIPDTNGRRFVAIATGFRHSLAILEDRTAIGWGDNDKGQTDVPDTNGRRFVGIAAGGYHSLGLLEDGTCIAWGDNYYGETDVPDTRGKRFVKIAAGDHHSLGLLEDGTVKAWGRNAYGETDVGGGRVALCAQNIDLSCGQD